MLKPPLDDWLARSSTVTPGCVYRHMGLATGLVLVVGGGLSLGLFFFAVALWWCRDKTNTSLLKLPLWLSRVWFCLLRFCLPVVCVFFFLWSGACLWFPACIFSCVNVCFLILNWYCALQFFFQFPWVVMIWNDALFAFSNLPLLFFWINDNVYFFLCLFRFVSFVFCSPTLLPKIECAPLIILGPYNRWWHVLGHFISYAFSSGTDQSKVDIFPKPCFMILSYRTQNWFPIMHSRQGYLRGPMIPWTCAMPPYVLKMCSCTCSLMHRPQPRPGNPKSTLFLTTKRTGQEIFFLRRILSSCSTAAVAS